MAETASDKVYNFVSNSVEYSFTTGGKYPVGNNWLLLEDGYILDNEVAEHFWEE